MLISTKSINTVALSVRAAQQQQHCAQPMVCILGGAICLTDQWQTRGAFVN